ncbi:MAG: type II secretion system F family protein [Defluviitaleaceae bacterium]|nr:type II secretion system F family protein [Defluviitaleaceae bacterium]
MIFPQITQPEAANAPVSIWHRDVGDLLARGAGKIPPNDLAVFCNKLSFLLEAGVMLKDVLPLLAEQSRGRMIRRILPEVHKKVLQGESLSDACAAVGAFPVFICGMFKVGEKTTQLPRVCAQLSEYYEHKVQARSELRAALLYPAMVSLMMLSVIIIAVTFVLPGYAQMFAASDVTLPWLTQALLRISDFVTARGLLLVFAILLLAIGLAVFVRSDKGRAFFSWLVLRFTLFRVGVSLHISQVLELMLHAGQPLSDALSLCAEAQGNTCVSSDLTRVEYEVAAGRTLGAALNDLIYLEPLLAGLVRVGEESGKLPQTLTQCRIHFETQHKRVLQRMNKLVEPIITLTMGILMALVMLAIVLPTFQLAGAL